MTSPITQFLLARIAEESRPLVRLVEGKMLERIERGDGDPDTLKVLAQRHASHPDYREEWGR